MHIDFIDLAWLLIRHLKFGLERYISQEKYFPFKEKSLYLISRLYEIIKVGVTTLN